MGRLLGAAVLVLCTVVTAPAVYFQPVEASLAASATRVEAGTPFSIGVLLRMQRGWHVYWLNPGDAGLATSVRWTLPEGFTAGPLRWPVPLRFEQPGGAVGYGYADTVLLAATVTPPARVDGDGPLPLRAEVGWLACEKLCIRGKKTLELALGGQPAAADPALFAEWARRLPVDADDPGAPASVTARGRVPPDGSAGGVTVTVNWKQAPVAVEWFPPDDVALDVQAATSRTDGSRTQLRLRAKRLPGQALERPTLESVLAWTDAAGARHGLRIPIDLDGKET